MAGVRKLTGKMIRTKLKGTSRNSLNKKAKKSYQGKAISSYLKKIGAT